MTTRPFRQGNVHLQIGGDFFQIASESGQVTARGQLQPRLRLEKIFAGHGRADYFAGEFLDVDAGAGQHGGDLPHNTRPIVTDNFQSDLSRGRGSRLRFIGAHRDLKRGDFLERGEQRRLLFRWNVHVQNTGKFAAESAQTAFEPVPAVPGNGTRYRFHQPRAVRADQGDHQGGLHQRVVTFSGASGKPSRLAPAMPLARGEGGIKSNRKKFFLRN